MKQYLNLRTIIALELIFAFLLNAIGPIPSVQAQEFYLPTPGVMVLLSPPLDPPLLKGIKIHPDNPFRFDFILDRGDSDIIPSEGKQSQQERLKAGSIRLIKYFLASLTIPEKDLWVNLSPYEKNRIIPESFGQTEMGIDLLVEDYMLKQITASLIYPEGETGKRFWKRIYKEAVKKYGTTNIPVNTFNKVWIIPEKAIVYENAKAGTAYVVESKLKVMLEQDYLSLSKHANSIPLANGVSNALGSQIVREIVIPELTKEVNENKNFARLRQVYSSLILAAWYKKKIKDSILDQVYTDKNRVAGVNINDPKEKEKIYQRYLQAFKKGAYNYIKDEIDPATEKMISRKYFSGGLGFTPENLDKAMIIEDDELPAWVNAQAERKDFNIVSVVFDSAMPTRHELPDHWNPKWTLPATEELARARKFLDILPGYLNKKENDLRSTIAVLPFLSTSFKELKDTSYFERARMLRALYYLSPNLAGAIITGFGGGYHSEWLKMLSNSTNDGRRILKGPDAIETEVLIAMINQGLALLDNDQVLHFNGKDIHLSKEDLAGIIGLLIKLPNRDNIIRGIKDDRLHLLIEQIAYYPASEFDEENWVSTNEIFKSIPASRMQRILGTLPPKIRKYVQENHSLPLPGPISLPKVKERIPRVVGKAVGRLLLIKGDAPNLSKLMDVSTDTIIAMSFLSTSNPEIGPFRGIITFRQEGETAHAQSRARIWKVPHALWPDSDPLLEKLNGKIVYFRVTKDHVELREATTKEKEDNENNPHRIEPSRIVFPIANLNGENFFLGPKSPLMLDPREVGYKAAMLNQLAQHPFIVSEPGIKIDMATGMAFPFRTFARYLEEYGQLQNFIRLKSQLGILLTHNEYLKVLSEIDSLVNPMRGRFFTNSGFLNSLFNFDWNNSGFRKSGVFVRTSVNVENMPNYPGVGTGLYRTEQNIKTENEFWGAVKDCWASAWRTGPFMERHGLGIDEARVYPAIWLVPSIPAKYSFVIHSSAQSTGQSDQMIIELVQGLGESLVSNDSMFAGFPTRVVWDKTTQSIINQTPAQKRRKSVLAIGGGTIVEPTNPQDEFLKQPDARRLIKVLAEIGKQTEDFFKGPQEIEGALSVDQDGYWKITLLQTRFIDHAMASKNDVHYHQASNVVTQARDSFLLEKGGIDLTPTKMNLQTQNAGNAIKFYLNPAQLDQLKNTPGFVPVIIDIQPMNDLRLFLGTAPSNNNPV